MCVDVGRILSKSFDELNDNWHFTRIVCYLYRSLVNWQKKSQKLLTRIMLKA